MMRDTSIGVIHQFIPSGRYYTVVEAPFPTKSETTWLRTDLGDIPLTLPIPTATLREEDDQIISRMLGGLVADAYRARMKLFGL